MGLDVDADQTKAAPAPETKVAPGMKGAPKKTANDDDDDDDGDGAGGSKKAVPPGPTVVSSLPAIAKEHSDAGDASLPAALPGDDADAAAGAPTVGSGNKEDS